jgi:hypothetical protein
VVLKGRQEADLAAYHVPCKVVFTRSSRQTRVQAVIHRYDW